MRYLALDFLEQRSETVSVVPERRIFSKWVREGMKRADDLPRHFSMMRSLQLADFLTLANAACGVAAVFCAMAFLGTHDGRYLAVAVAFAPAAFVFDVLDGRVARWRQRHSPCWPLPRGKDASATASMGASGASGRGNCTRWCCCSSCRER